MHGAVVETGDGVEGGSATETEWEDSSAMEIKGKEGSTTDTGDGGNKRSVMETVHGLHGSNK